MIVKKVQHAKKDAGPVSRKLHGVISEELHLKPPIKPMIASVSDCQLIAVFRLNGFVKCQDGEDDFLKDMYQRVTDAFKTLKSVTYRRKGASIDP